MFVRPHASVAIPPSEASPETGAHSGIAPSPTRAASECRRLPSERTSVRNRLRPSATNRVTRAPRRTSTPWARYRSTSRAPTSRPRTRSSGPRPAARSTTSTPSPAAVEATSVPTKPAPTTVSRLPARSALRRASASRSERSVCTPRTAGPGKRLGRAPVARTSASHANTFPVVETAVRRDASTKPIRVPSTSSISRSAQNKGGRRRTPSDSQAPARNSFESAGRSYRLRQRGRSRPASSSELLPACGEDGDRSHGARGGGVEDRGVVTFADERLRDPAFVEAEDLRRALGTRGEPAAERALERDSVGSHRDQPPCSRGTGLGDGRASARHAVAAATAPTAPT